MIAQFPEFGLKKSLQNMKTLLITYQYRFSLQKRKVYF